MTNIIQQPVISEKSIQLGGSNKYTFRVDKRANAPEIKKDIEKLFKVKVKQVNVINVTGKPKTMQRMKVRRTNFKKAIITLMPGNSIKMFEDTQKDAS